MPLVHEDECLGVLLMTSAHELGKLPGRIFGLLEIVTAELGTRLERDRLRSELAAQASTDPLTGLANRRSWDERVGHAVIAAGKAPLCMAILDLDHFKLFNDTHGHQAGDLLLREVAAAWSAQIRSGDLLARLGGEEFGLMLPGCTVEDAMPVLNAVRLAVPQGQTVSIGLSQRRTDETVSTWYARTDQALYRAKAMGRDRVQTDADGFGERRQHPPIPTQAEVPEPTGESRTP
jgi:diguanylate cyclase (GGDEF)-like protein